MVGSGRYPSFGKLVNGGEGLTSPNEELPLALARAARGDGDEGAARVFGDDETDGDGARLA